MEVTTEQLLQTIGEKQVTIESLQRQLVTLSRGYVEMKNKYEPEGVPSETDQPAEA